MDAPDPVPQEAPSESSPSPAPAHLRPMDFLENPARATRVSQGANAGRGQSDDDPGNAATLHGAHASRRTHSCGTTGNKSGWACSQHLMAPSQKTSRAALPRRPSSSGRSSLTKLSGAPHLHQSRPRWYPMSPLSADSVRVPASAGPALHSALPTRKGKYGLRQHYSTQKAENTNYSLKETATEPSPPHKRSNTMKLFGGQWHESRWRRDRSRTDLKQKENHGKTWSQHGTILVNSSFEHKNYHHRMPALTAPCSDLDCGQPQGHHAGAPQLTEPGSW